MLTRDLNPRIFESLLVTGVESPTEGTMRYLADENGVRPLVVEALGREVSPLNDVKTLLDMYRVIRRNKPDIVHTHMAKAGTTARLAAWLARVPIIVHTYHGHVFHSYFSPRKTAMFLAIERTLGKLTDRIVVVGDKQKDEIAGFNVAPMEKLVAIPLGLPLEPFLTADDARGELRRDIGIENDIPLVGIVARLVPIKAHEYFLQAAQRISAQRDDVHFAVVGDGERREELETMGRDLGIADRVHFLGWRRDMRQVYADLDVVVLSSLNEGSPVAVIEAMAAARPVVATSVGGVGEVVDDGTTGILVPPRDADAIASGVLRFLGDPAWSKAVGLAGRSSVVPRYAVSRLVGDIERLYVDLAQTKGLVA